MDKTYSFSVVNTSCHSSFPVCINRRLKFTLAVRYVLFFVALWKADSRLPREELRCCVRVSRVYLRVVYDDSETVVRGVGGVRGGFKVEVELHQGLALSAFLFVLVMDRLSDEVRQESLWTLRIADNVLNCSERRKWVEERWRGGGVCVCVCAREKRNACQQKKRDKCMSV